MSHQPMLTLNSGEIICTTKPCNNALLDYCSIILVKVSQVNTTQVNLEPCVDLCTSTLLYFSIFSTCSKLQNGFKQFIHLLDCQNKFEKKKQKTKEDVHVLLQLCLTLRVYIQYYITLIGYTPHFLLAISIFPLCSKVTVF